MIVDVPNNNMKVLFLYRVTYELKLNAPQFISQLRIRIRIHGYKTSSRMEQNETARRPRYYYPALRLILSMTLDVENELHTCKLPTTYITQITKSCFCCLVNSSVLFKSFAAVFSSLQPLRDVSNDSCCQVTSNSSIKCQISGQINRYLS